MYMLKVDLHLLTNPLRRLLISKITFTFERKIYTWLEKGFTKLSVTSKMIILIQYNCMHLIWSNLIIFEVTLVSTYQPLS